MATTVKTFAPCVTFPQTASTSMWASQWGDLNPTATQSFPTTSWYSMPSDQNTSSKRYIAVSWDHKTHNYYFKLDYSNRSLDELIWRFKAGCHECDFYASKLCAKNAQYLHVEPLFKQVRLSLEATNYIFDNETTGLKYAQEEFIYPMYAELHELHLVIDQLYYEDHVQQYKYAIKF